LLAKHFIRTQSAQFMHVAIVALPNACFPQQTFLQFWQKPDLFLHDTNWWFFSQLRCDSTLIAVNAVWDVLGH